MTHRSGDDDAACAERLLTARPPENNASLSGTGHVDRRDRFAKNYRSAPRANCSGHGIHQLPDAVSRVVEAVRCRLADQ